MFDDDNKWRDAASNFMAIVMIVILAMVLVFIILAATLKEANATNLCMSHDDVVSMLDNKYSEGRVAAGIASNGKLVEVYTTQDGETWTITVTTPGGTTCILATGEAWNDKIITAIEGPQA